MKYPIDFLTWREHGEFVSQCLNVNVASCGSTREAAITNLIEAVELRLEDEEAPDFGSMPSLRLGHLLVKA